MIVTPLCIALLVGGHAQADDMSPETAKMIMRGPTPISPPKSEWNIRSTRIVELAEEVVRSRGAAVAKGLVAFFNELERVRVGEKHQIYEAIAILAKAEHVASALQTHYQRIPRGDYAKRHQALEVIGELRDARNLEFLLQLTRSKLPPAKQGKAEFDSAREREEELHSKAVQGIGYIRDAEGRVVSDAVAGLLSVIRNHSSLAVRVEAVDVYMWNHGDAPAAADRLYAALPKDLHKFVARPRVHRGSDAVAIAQRIDAWNKKWVGK